MDICSFLPTVTGVGQQAPGFNNQPNNRINQATFHPQTRFPDYGFNDLNNNNNNINDINDNNDNKLTKSSRQEVRLTPFLVCFNEIFRLI